MPKCRLRRIESDVVVRACAPTNQLKTRMSINARERQTCTLTHSNARICVQVGIDFDRAVLCACARACSGAPGAPAQTGARPYAYASEFRTTWRTHAINTAHTTVLCTRANITWHGRGETCLLGTATAQQTRNWFYARLGATTMYPNGIPNISARHAVRHSAVRSNASRTTVPRCGHTQPRPHASQKGCAVVP